MDIEKVLVGNKCDMTDEKMIEAEQGAALANEFGMQFFETSAKTGLNVQEAFIYLAKKVKEKREKMAALNPAPQVKNDEGASANPNGNQSNIKIGGETGKAGKDGKKKKKGCC
jgi:Ras-related protein Rab-8A